MKILFIRHGEPNYRLDTLTPNGWKEAEALGQYLKDIPIDGYYVSTMGRAKATASFTLEAKGVTPEYCDWLREFGAGPYVHPSYGTETGLLWDWYPADTNRYPEVFEREGWRDNECYTQAGVGKVYDDVNTHLDALLARYGYRRGDGYLYTCEEGHHQTIALFCHFGVTCVMLSHLLGISPIVLWHNACALPTSITTVVTEEREKGIANFRMIGFGETPHLLKAGIEPSFAARFRETYEDIEPPLEF